MSIKYNSLPATLSTDPALGRRLLTQQKQNKKKKAFPLALAACSNQHTLTLAEPSEGGCTSMAGFAWHEWRCVFLASHTSPFFKKLPED